MLPLHSGSFEVVHLIGYISPPVPFARRHGSLCSVMELFKSLSD